MKCGQGENSRPSMHNDKVGQGWKCLYDILDSASQQSDSRDFILDLL